MGALWPGMLTAQTQRRWFPTWKPGSAAKDQVDKNLKRRFRWCSKLLQLPDLLLYDSQPLFTSVAWTWRRTPRTSCFIPSRAWRPWRGGLSHYCSAGRADRDPGVRQVESTSSAATLWAEANSAPSWLGWTTNCFILQRLTWEWRRDESISFHLGGVSRFFGSPERATVQCLSHPPAVILDAGITPDVTLPPRSSLLFLPWVPDNRGVLSFFHAFYELTVYLALKLIFGRKSSLKVCAAIINRFLWINGDLPKKSWQQIEQNKKQKTEYTRSSSNLWWKEVLWYLEVLSNQSVCFHQT